MCGAERHAVFQCNFLFEVTVSYPQFLCFEKFHIELINLMYVCPCIIYENDERYQLDATIYLLL